MKGLKTAKLMPTGPFNNEPKLRGRAAEGIRHQNKVASLLQDLSPQGDLRVAQWIKGRDSNGDFWLQVDTALEARDRVVIVESKLSLRRLDEAMRQLRSYRLCLEHIFQKPAVCLVAFHHWFRGADLKLIDEPQDLLFLPLPDRACYGWHVL